MKSKIDRSKQNIHEIVTLSNRSLHKFTYSEFLNFLESKKIPDSAIIDIDMDFNEYEYEYESLTLSFSWNREENEDEYTNRIALEEKVESDRKLQEKIRRKVKLDSERQQYERLKAKFEKK